MAKPGRKPWIPTPEICEKIRQLASQGVTEMSMIKIVGTNHDTWYKAKKKYPEMAEALKDGHAKGEATAVKYLWDIMDNPNHRAQITALIFYLKSRHRWSTHSTLEIQQPPEKPNLDNKTDEDILHELEKDQDNATIH